MRIFEFAFNPKKSKSRFFEVFSYEPKSPKEKPKGSLYIVGELDNALEFNARFLRRLSSLIQAEYYASLLKGAGSAMKNALKKANLSLAEESKRGNVDWLGNLHLALLLFITVKEKKVAFHTAATGSCKVFLVRESMLLDVAKSKETQPGKVFGNLVSGTLIPGDSVTVATKDIVNILLKEKSFLELGSFKETKEFRSFFEKRSRLFSQNSGVLISFVIEEETAKRSLPVRKSLFPAFPKPRLMLPKSKNLKIPNLKLDLPWLRNPSAAKKRLSLILLFLLLLFLGYLFF